MLYSSFRLEERYKFFIEYGKKCILAISSEVVLIFILYELFSSSHTCSTQHQLLLLYSIYNRLAVPAGMLKRQGSRSGSAFSQKRLYSSPNLGANYQFYLCSERMCLS